MHAPHFIKHLRIWWIITLTLVLVTAIGASAAWYGYNKFTALSQQVAELNGALASTTVTLEADIAKTNVALSSHKGRTLPPLPTR